MRRTMAGRLRPWLAGLLVLAALPALAGRGRHGVEDAELLEPGECVLESAVTRLAGGAMRYLLEPACRIGPVQLSAETEHTRLHPGSGTDYGLEVKWSMPAGPRWRVGLMLRPDFDAQAHPHYQGTVPVALATWKAREDLGVHFNVGRTLGRMGSSNRGGVAVEWTTRPGPVLMLERYFEDRTHFGRAALRWPVGKRWLVDVGRAQRLAGPVPSQWGIGVSLELGD